MGCVGSRARVQRESKRDAERRRRRHHSQVDDEDSTTHMDTLSSSSPRNNNNSPNQDPTPSPRTGRHRGSSATNSRGLVSLIPLHHRDSTNSTTFAQSPLSPPHPHNNNNVHDRGAHRISRVSTGTNQGMMLNLAGLSSSTHRVGSQITPNTSVGYNGSSVAFTMERSATEVTDDSTRFVQASRHSPPMNPSSPLVHTVSSSSMNSASGRPGLTRSRVANMIMVSSFGSSNSMPGGPPPIVSAGSSAHILRSTAMNASPPNTAATSRSNVRHTPLPSRSTSFHTQPPQSTMGDDDGAHSDWTNLVPSNDATPAVSQVMSPRPAQQQRQVMTRVPTPPPSQHRINVWLHDVEAVVTTPEPCDVVSPDVDWPDSDIDSDEYNYDESLAGTTTDSDSSDSERSETPNNIEIADRGKTNVDIY